MVVLWIIAISVVIFVFATLASGYQERIQQESKRILYNELDVLIKRFYKIREDVQIRVLTNPSLTDVEKNQKVLVLKRIHNIYDSKVASVIPQSMLTLTEEMLSTFEDIINEYEEKVMMIG